MENLFDDSLIEEFTEFQNCNDFFTWHSFVNMKADIDTALGFAKFFCPEIIIVDGCFLLKDRYDPEIFSLWKKECKTKTDIEKMMNLCELEDFFCTNSEIDEHYTEKSLKLGEILKLFWSVSFRERFKDKEIVVELISEYDEHFITVFEKYQT